MSKYEIYQHRIKANEQMGERLTMIATANQFWLWQLDKLSTNVTRMHQDPGLWLEQVYLELDINRLKC